MNIKIVFGALVSGMLMEVYKRFSSGANFGIVTDDLIDHKTVPALKTVAREVAMMQ